MLEETKCARSNQNKTVYEYITYLVDRLDTTNWFSCRSIDNETLANQIAKERAAHRSPDGLATPDTHFATYQEVLNYEYLQIRSKYKNYCSTLVFTIAKLDI